MICSPNMVFIQRSLTYCRLKLLKTSLNCHQIKKSYHSIDIVLSKDQKTSEERDSRGEDERTIYDRVKYTTSDAHLKHKAYQNFRWADEEVDETLVYERLILMLSAVIFFLYFDYFREQNELDKKLNSSPFELVPGLELPVIEQAVRDAELVGNDTRQLRERLNELKQLKQEVDRLEANKTTNK